MVVVIFVSMVTGAALWELVKFVTEERRETIETRYDRLRRAFLAGGKEEGGDGSGGDMFDYRDRMYRDREFKEGRR